MTTQEIKRLIINYQIQLNTFNESTPIHLIGETKGKIKLLINMYNTALTN